MNTIDCIVTRRSIRQFKPDQIPHSLLAQIVQAAAYAPSWKNTQITRYVAIESSSLKDKIAKEYTPSFNSVIVENAPLLIAITIIKNRCGYERDGSFSTSRKDAWQMYDAGIAAQTFCLAAYEYGLGTVTLGIFDYEKTAELLEIGEDRELISLIAIGYPNETPEAPKRKTVTDLLSYK